MIYSTIQTMHIFATNIKGELYRAFTVNQKDAKIITQSNKKRETVKQGGL